MRFQGKVTGWKDDQGYGFVIPNGGGDKAFVHIKSFSRQSRRPAEGDIITYELGKDDKRRFRADNIRFASEPLLTRKVSTRWYGCAFAAIFYAFLVLISLMGKLPPIMLWLYSGASAFTLLMYAIDKSSARNNRDRISEQTLQALALMGGWPGALIAQKLFRHKTKKVEFQRVFWATVVINCCVFAWIFIKDGTALYKALIG